MKKVFYLLIIFLFPIWVSALEYPSIYSKSAIVYDLTEDKVLYELKAREEKDIASLTKIMTTITAIEMIDDLNKEVIITQEMLNQVRWDASVAGLRVGNVVTYKDLLYASMLPSGADATVSLGVSLSGSVSNFVEKMNELAKRIGLEDSHFVNVHGLDQEGHYSTAYDVLKLLDYALDNKLFKEIYTSKEYTLTNGLKVKSTIHSYNKKMNLDTSRILGSKTGFTLGAGYCLSTLFISDEHEFIIITLGADKVDGKFNNIIDNMNLINFIDDNYNEQELVNKGVLVETLKVKNSKIDNYEIKTGSKVFKFLPNDYDKNKVNITYVGIQELSYKNKVNEKIGEIIYYYDKEEIFRENIILDINIEKDIWKIIISYKLYIFLLIFILLIMLFIIKKVSK